MYQAPQTFLWDDSPPSSPTETVQVPIVQISAALEQEDRERKKAHRRWNSYEHMIQHPKPFSYEYKLENGHLAGLAEYHPDEDYLHYTSSRSTSRSVSRNTSARTSKEVSLRPSFDLPRTSTSSQTPRPDPPPSPKKIGALKRALSLRNLARRGSTEGTRTAPSSPRQRPGIEKLAASFGPRGPQNITLPIPSPPERSPREFYEGPRAAPQPPQRQISRLERRPEALREIKANACMPLSRRPLAKEVVSAREIPYPIKAPTQRTLAPPGTAITSSEKVQSQTQMKSPASTTAPRPLLRHKISRFVEHVDDVEQHKTQSAQQDKTQPVMACNSLPPFDFQLPATPPSLDDSTLPQLACSEEQKDTERPTDNPIDQHSDENYSKTTYIAAEKPTIKSLEKKVHFVGPWQQNMSRKRSAVNMKTLPPTPGGLIKRSTSTRSRPPAPMGDVCMAEVRPVLTSPVIAFGHARMVSC